MPQDVGDGYCRHFAELAWTSTVRIKCCSFARANSISTGTHSGYLSTTVVLVHRVFEASFLQSGFGQKQSSNVHHCESMS